jgi:hypothetical protein
MVIKWKTKEGFEIAPKDMATQHLLSTIHMIERNRMTNLIGIGLMDSADMDADIIDYYSTWPEAYEALLDEAERRHLIGRTKSQIKKLKSR